MFSEKNSDGTALDSTALRPADAHLAQSIFPHRRVLLTSIARPLWEHDVLEHFVCALLAVVKGENRLRLSFNMEAGCKARQELQHCTSMVFFFEV